MAESVGDSEQVYPSQQVAKVLGVARSSLNYLGKKVKITPKLGPDKKQANTLCKYYSLEDMAKMKAVLSRTRPRQKITAP